MLLLYSKFFAAYYFILPIINQPGLMDFSVLIFYRFIQKAAKISLFEAI